MTITPAVKRVLVGENISLPELEKMLSRAAITRSLGYNRRFNHWLFKVQGDVVQTMANDEVVKVGKGESPMQEDCPKCGGKRCQKCNWHGFIYRLID